MNPRWVILFAAVAQDRSFTRAAARLNLAQPWLSAQIRKLEAELGVTLFVREKNRIQLTDEGARLLPSANQLANAAERFRTLARELGADRGTVVHIGTHVAAMGVKRFFNLNEAFRTRYPNLGFEVRNGRTDILLEAVRGGVLDIAMVMPPFSEDGLEVLVLKEEQAYLLAPNTAPWREAKHVDAALLAGKTIGVMPRERHPAFYDAVLAPLAGTGARLRPVLEADGRAMMDFVKSEQTPAVMVEAEAEAFERRPAFTALPFSPPLILRHCLVRPKDALAGRAADRYWRLAQAHASEDLAD